MAEYEEKPAFTNEAPPEYFAATGEQQAPVAAVVAHPIPGPVIAHPVAHSQQYVLGAVSTDAVHDPRLDNAQAARTSVVTKVLAAFAVLAFLLGLSIFLLNVIPVGQGVKVYSGSRFGSLTLTTRRPRRVNFYPGIWYGVLNVLGCIGVLFVCDKTLKRTRSDSFFIFNDSTTRSLATLLSTFFGILAAVGIAAMSCAAVTTVALDLENAFVFGSDCRTTSSIFGDGSCACTSGSLVVGVSSCSYAMGTLRAVYRSITTISAFLVVINIVIASLFCGALCCCKISPHLYPVTARQQHVIVTSSAAYPPQQMAQPTAPPYMFDAAVY